MRSLAPFLQRRISHCKRPDKLAIGFWRYVVYQGCALASLQIGVVY